MALPLIGQRSRGLVSQPPVLSSCLTNKVRIIDNLPIIVKRYAEEFFRQVDQYISLGDKYGAIQNGLVTNAKTGNASWHYQAEKNRFLIHGEADMYGNRDLLAIDVDQQLRPQQAHYTQTRGSFPHWVNINLQTNTSKFKLLPDVQPLIAMIKSGNQKEMTRAYEIIANTALHSSEYLGKLNSNQQISSRPSTTDSYKATRVASLPNDKDIKPRLEVKSYWCGMGDNQGSSLTDLTTNQLLTSDRSLYSNTFTVPRVLPSGQTINEFVYDGYYTWNLETLKDPQGNSVFIVIDIKSETEERNSLVSHKPMLGYNKNGQEVKFILENNQWVLLPNRAAA